MCDADEKGQEGDIAKRDAVARGGEVFESCRRDFNAQSGAEMQGEFRLRLARDLDGRDRADRLVRLTLEKR